MKITRRRTAISQSMDLFIIIAAVLGVGGVVSASIYNLVSSATSNSSITIVGASLKAGASSSVSPLAIAISIKNNGGTPIACRGSGACEVVVANTSTGAGGATCNAPCSIISGGALTWGVGKAAGPLTFYLSSNSTQLAAGSEASFVLTGPLQATLPSYWSAGTPVTINVLFGSASAQVTVVSQ
ncbi:MAG: hypothetical protein JRN57_02590 [Nitrososphaerota archaeon]|nr:hypothetical protein [Nitrososphaerota archaeon]